MGGAVAADRVKAIGDQLADVRLDSVADRSHVLDRLAGRVGYVPRLHGGRHVGAGVAAAHRDRPIGVKLHLKRELLGLAPSEVEADLAHRFDDGRPDLGCGFGAGGLGAHVLGAVALEERLRHLRAPGVVVADEQHVADGPLARLRFDGVARRRASRRIVLHRQT